MNTKIASFWDDFIDLLFPRVCPACKRLMTGTEYQLCTRCLVSLPRIRADGMIGAMLQRKFAAFVEVKSIRSFLSYQPKGHVQSLLQSLKYHSNPDLGEFMGRLCCSEWGGAIPRADIIVPVPLHPKKKKERGYNQSEVFADGLSELSSIPVDGSLLIRNFYTLSQTGKSKADRIADMQDVFSVRAGVNLSDLSVILTDDVLTTGATLEACVEALVKNGCREIHIITIAAAHF